jgi:hypothetical protein
MATSPPVDDSLHLLLAGGVAPHIVDLVSPEVWARQRAKVRARLADEEADRVLRTQAAKVLAEHLLRGGSCE